MIILVLEMISFSQKRKKKMKSDLSFAFLQNTALFHIFNPALTESVLGGKYHHHFICS